MVQSSSCAGVAMTVQPIGVISSCFSEKFAIPRQPGLIQHSAATLILYPPYNREELVRGLDGFSHIWVQFLFHRTVAEGWRPTVRPPRLGGRKRVGIFACRSPHRPNHIGLSAVRLQRIETGPDGVQLHLSGVDLLDNTPVLDIKPYLPYSDAVADASSGFASAPDSGEKLSGDIFFSDAAAAFCRRYQARTERPLRALIMELIAADPRPRSQRATKKEFGMLLWEVDIRWRIEQHRVLVFSCHRQNR